MKKMDTPHAPPHQHGGWVPVGLGSLRSLFRRSWTTDVSAHCLSHLFTRCTLMSAVIHSGRLQQRLKKNQDDFETYVEIREKWSCFGS